jgi:hypothetical protein
LAGSNRQSQRVECGQHQLELEQVGAMILAQKCWSRLSSATSQQRQAIELLGDDGQLW